MDTIRRHCVDEEGLLALARAIEDLRFNKNAITIWEESDIINRCTMDFPVNTTFRYAAYVPDFLYDLWAGMTANLDKKVYSCGGTIIFIFGMRR